MADKNRKQESSRREIRRKRRIRNQMISYVTLGVLLAAVIAGVFFAGRFVSEKLSEKRHEQKLAEELAALEETEETQETEAETEEVEEYTDDDLLEEMIDACISDMTVEDKVAGLFLTTPESLTDVDAAIKAGSGTQEALGKYAVGGLLYSSKNVKSESQFSEMLTETISKSKYPLFLTMGEERGGLSDDLSQYGINMEFVPVKGEEVSADSVAQTVEMLLLVNISSCLDSFTEEADREAVEAGISAGADVVLAGTDMLSVLRTELKYEGTAAVMIEGGGEEAVKSCVDALEKGADLLYVQEDVKAVCDGLLKAVQEDTLKESRINDSLERIYRIKYRGRLEG